MLSKGALLIKVCQFCSVSNVLHCNDVHDHLILYVPQLQLTVWVGRVCHEARSVAPVSCINDIARTAGKITLSQHMVNDFDTASWYNSNLIQQQSCAAMHHLMCRKDGSETFFAAYSFLRGATSLALINSPAELRQVK